MWLPGFGPGEDPLAIAASNQDQDTAPELPAEAIQRNKSCSIIRAARPVSTPKAVWPTLDRSFMDGLGGQKGKFDANLAAIKLLKQLEPEKLAPSDEERNTLNRFTGWGGIPQAFQDRHSDQGFNDRIQALKELLTEDELATARASTPNAHFTSPEVVEAIWDAVQRMGFKGGRILEPSAGNGYFIGAMPKKIAEKSQVTAVELEPMSARFTKALYGQYGVKVHNCGFEAAKLPEGFFDLVISNVPFGDYPVPETRSVAFKKFNVHNYFFAKALEVTRPGGLVAFVTSRYTMDQSNTTVREYLAQHGELVGAIRLPAGTFQKIANTDVVTDIIFLRKREQLAVDPDVWADPLVDLSPGHELREEFYSKIRINRYFADNPEWVIGKCVMRTTQFGYGLSVEYEGELEAALKQRVANLPTGVYKDRAAEVEVKPRTYFAAAAEWVKPGAYVIHEGKVAVSHGDQVEVAEDTMQKARATRIKAMIPVRDALRKLVAIQAATDDDSKVERYREALNLTYNGFIKRFGYISERMNSLAFRADPDFPLMLSLEKWDEEERTAEKAPIFFRRTVGAVNTVERCETHEEALLVCLGERGKVVPSRVAELLEQDEDSAMAALAGEGLVFKDPETGSWTERDAFLSGNVRKKLLAAEQAGMDFAREAEALRGVVPADLGPSEISVRLGATWIPVEVFEEFGKDHLGFSQCGVSLNTAAGSWTVQGNKWGVPETQTWGTTRAPGPTLMEMAMNQQTPQITDKDPNDPDGKKRVVNAKETVAATEKLEAIKDGFVAWLWSDSDRADRLVRIYNDEFNSIVTRSYDGSHLTLPGFSNAYQLRPNQKNGVWRVVSSRDNTLLAHAVGAGKTLTMICAGMEMRRMGLASKPAYVVPNHMLQQFAAEFLRAYPTANVLLASKEDMAPANRKVFLAKVAMGDWDGVVITHSSFEKLALPADYSKQFVGAIIAQQELAIRLEKDEGDTRMVKQLERQKKVWEARLTWLTNEAEKDDHLTFDQLGIDFIAVDEAHLFKNLYRFTRMRMAGLPTNDSKRAFDMFMKTRYIMEKRGDGKGIVFATGTPIANSVSELWVQSAYLQPRLLASLGMDMFDAWAANFGEPVTALELAPDGSSYRMHTRFARFVNVPELMAIFREVADIQTAEMLDLPVPEVIRETVSAKPSAKLKEYVESLVKRADDIKARVVSDPRVDNMLKVTTDGRKAATDLRLVGIDEDCPGSKTNLAIENIEKVWQDTAATKGTQLVFLDMGTPNGPRWSLYGDMKAKLVARGIPEEEIAFIHDANTDKQKETLFQAVRDGRVRVLFGSTEKMGMGTNVQNLLVALHHIDGPWRPADVEQREGRIIRQGNTTKVARIYRYVTEGSFDAYVWQTLETKAKFIAQVMSGDNTVRTLEDAELAALSYAEVKALASGNPLIIEKAGVDAEVMRLSMLQSKWRDQQFSNRRELADLPGRIERMESALEKAKADGDQSVSTAGDNFRIELDGKLYVDREEAGKRLLGILMTTRTGQVKEVGKIGSFLIEVEGPRGLIGSPSVSLLGELAYEVSMGDSAVGNIRRLEHAQMSAPFEEASNFESRLLYMKDRLEQLDGVRGVEFEHKQRLDDLLARQEQINRELGVHEGDNTVAVDVDMAKAA